MGTPVGSLRHGVADQLEGSCSLILKRRGQIFKRDGVKSLSLTLLKISKEKGTVLFSGIENLK
jgi:hypothetical protein